ncbi:MAG: hypothetical protein CVT65_00870 [Actinobacteria bacterium HGW-Actinobacteria-5]|jgi:hypothetical protein|nr:MAG: hypothetical protein CVT65_00870 [Actinobacteria bacterium HGW-Actinobacteria-5]
MTIRLLLGVVVTASLAIGTAGCTTPQAPTTAPTPTATSSPTSASQSASPTVSTTPTPSQTLDANQAAAVSAVRGFWAADAKVGADPAAFTKAQMNAEFGRYLGGDALTSQVGYFTKLKGKGHRRLGEIAAVWIKASDVADNHSARGLEVHVTVCQDQTTLQLVDKAGQPVANQPTDFNLRQYSVRKPAKETRWRVYGAVAASGECGR